MMALIIFLARISEHGVRPAMHEARANVIGLFNQENNDSSVSYLTRLRSATDGFDDVIHPTVIDHNLDLQFRTKSDGVLHATVCSRVSALSSMSVNFGYGEAGNHG